MQGISKEAREAYRDDHLSEWMEKDDADRKLIQKEIDEFSVRLERRPAKPEGGARTTGICAFPVFPGFRIPACSDESCRDRYRVEGTI